MTAVRPPSRLYAMKTRFLRTALILGLLSAIGPVAIDMYLPALPTIGQSLGASIGAVQASLMAFFIALGLGQLIYGPVSDMVGRKPPLYFGLMLFAIGSVGCALAPDIHTLVAMRFVQGLGACAGSVVPRAVVRDLYTGHQALRLMSTLMLVFSVSPILAPLAGSLLIEWQGWRSTFWFMLAAGLLGLALVATQMSETRPREQRAASSWRQALRGLCHAAARPPFPGPGADRRLRRLQLLRLPGQLLLRADRALRPDATPVQRGLRGQRRLLHRHVAAHQPAWAGASASCPWCAWPAGATPAP